MGLRHSRRRLLRFIRDRRLAITAVALACVSASAVADERRNIPWHLDDACETGDVCMRMAEVWSRYGDGQPNVTVLVAEPKLHADTHAASLWHAGLAPSAIEILPSPTFSAFEPPDKTSNNAEEDIAQNNAVYEQLDAARGRRAQARFKPPEVRGSEEFCAFVTGASGEGARNHDLKMAALIGGRSYNGSIGVASGVNLALTQASANRDDTDFLKAMLGRRPDIRVLNLSQGFGRASNIREARPHREHYNRLVRFAMEIAPTVRFEGRSSARLLIVAAAGNVPAHESTLLEPKEVLDDRIPPQAVHYGTAVFETVDLRPHYLNDFPRPSLPLLVVGAIGPEGIQPSFGRIDRGIDLYAPSGLDWTAIVRNDMAKGAIRNAASWSGCLCAAVAEQQGTLLRDDPNAGAEQRAARSTPELTAKCRWLLDGPERRNLGVPTLDFHRNSITAKTSTSDLQAGLSKICRDRAEGVCQAYVTGTSVSTALVSGVAALMFSLDPSLSGEEAAAILRRTATRERRHGLPVVNPMAAMDAVAQRIANRLASTLAGVDGALSISRPFYFAFGDGEGAVFRTHGLARRYLNAEAASRLGLRLPIRIERLDQAMIVQCPVGVAGSAMGLARLLRDEAGCASDADAVRVLLLDAAMAGVAGEQIVRSAWRWLNDEAGGRWALAGLRKGVQHND